MSEPLPNYGPCPTRLDNQPTPSKRPWTYGHAASRTIHGAAHWDIYAGGGIDGWLVGMVTTEADARLIVEAVTRQEAVAAYREALMPFANLDDEGLDRSSAVGLATAGGTITWAMLDNARALIEQDTPPAAPLDVAECGFGEPHEPHEYVVARDGKPVDLPCPGLTAAPLDENRICKCGLAKSYHGYPTNLADHEYEAQP